MKKIWTFLLLILFIFNLGCSSDSTVSSIVPQHKQVEIMLPEDDTVGGYRTENSDNSLPDKITADKVVTASESKNTKTAAAYYGNKNSHVFHTADCASAIKMKDENKASFSTREAAVAAGYSPCKRCNP